MGPPPGSTSNGAAAGGIQPQDKPRVERTVPFVRGSFFAGESFLDLADAQRRAEIWCLGRAGMRIHGTTQCRPAELFELEEAARLLPAPTEAYDLPTYATAQVHRDHHIEVARACIRCPGTDRHPSRGAGRPPTSEDLRQGAAGQDPSPDPTGGRSTDPEDLPSEQTACAMRDRDHLRRLAASHGEAIGVYAAAVLDHPLPWTKMRSVYALLGLVKKWGAVRVEAASRKALDAEAIHVPLIGRMLERGTEDHQPDQPRPPTETNVVTGRFARDPSHFALDDPPRGATGFSPEEKWAASGISRAGSEGGAP